MFMEMIKAHATLTYSSDEMAFSDGNNIVLTLSNSSGAILNSIIKNHPSGIISRESVSHILWPKKHNIDYSAALNQRVYKLRKELANIGLHEIIMTVPGKGYKINKTFFNVIEFYTPSKEILEVKHVTNKQNFVAFICLLVLFSLWML
jgi:DNA-binding winged helix-turn-helix (wHTH) protein